MILRCILKKNAKHTSRKAWNWIGPTQEVRRYFFANRTRTLRDEHGEVLHKVNVACSINLLICLVSSQKRHRILLELLQTITRWRFYKDVLLEHAKTWSFLNFDTPWRTMSQSQWMDISRKSENKNYLFMMEAIFTFLLALLMFRAGIRRNNDDVLMAGRNKFSSLFYIMNHPKYREIDWCDSKDRYLIEYKVKTCLST